MIRAASKFLLFAVFALLCLTAMPHGHALAQDEIVELDTSLREISIGSDFRGADIVIFGAVDDSKQKDADSNYYDIVIIIRGPSETVITRRKENHLGIWVNGKSREFKNVPSFYGVLSTKPLDEIADPVVFRRLYIELDPTSFDKKPVAPDEFEEALIRLKTQHGLYVQDPKGVEFLSKSLYRASLELPTGVAEGNYSIRLYLFHDRRLLSWDQSNVGVRKAGIERYLYTMAYDEPYAYGVIAVAIAVFSGLIGWTIFGRN